MTADNLTGLSRAIGGPTEIELGGRSFRAEGLTLSDFAELENLIKATRPSVIGEVVASLSSLSPDLAETIYLRALEHDRNIREISIHDVLKFIQTPPGLVAALETVLHRSNPTIARDEIKQVAQNARLPEVHAAMEKIREASGDGPLDSSTSPPPTKLPKGARRSRGQSRSAK